MKRSILLAALSLVAFACVKKKNNSDMLPVDSYIYQLKDPVQPRVEDTTVVGEIKRTVVGDYSCTEKKVVIGHEFSRQMLINPQSDVIYPGSMLDGNSIITGDYRPLVFDRAPMKLSISLEAIAGNRSAVVQSPSLSSVREAISTIINQGVDGNTPSNMTFEYFDVTDERNLNIALGLSKVASVKLEGTGSLTNKVKANLEYNSTTKKNKFLFRYVQSYYTIDVDAPRNPSMWFKPEVTSADLAKQITSGTVPVYVSSVNYGRVVYFCLSSDFSFREVKAAWEREVAISIAKGKSSIDPSFSLNQSIDRSTILSSTNISAVVIGGNAAGGSSLVDVINNRDALTNFIKDGANYSKNNPGLPIGYVLRRVSDNSVFKVVDYNEFIIRDCKKNQADFKLFYFRSVKGDNDRVYGEIKVTLGYNSTGLSNISFTAFSNNASNPVLMLNNEPKEVQNQSSDVLIVDPNRVNEAYVLIEFKNFVDIDGSFQDDNYTNLTIRVNYSDLRPTVIDGTSDQVQTNNQGLWLAKMRSKIDNTQIGEHCCEQVFGICTKRCPSYGPVSQDAEFEIAFTLTK